MGGTSGTVNFSTAPKQTCMYVANLVNDVIYVMSRRNLIELMCIGGGRQASQFHWPHVVANDSNGRSNVCEVDGAARVQKFLRYGTTVLRGAMGQGVRRLGSMFRKRAIAERGGFRFYPFYLLPSLESGLSH